MGVISCHMIPGIRQTALSTLHLTLASHGGVLTSRPTPWSCALDRN